MGVHVLSLREAMGTIVVRESGKRVGRVVDVLFKPEGREVTGYVVERPRLLYLFDRKDVFLARDRTRISKGRVVVASTRDAWGKSAERRSGIPWDETVIWIGMPARTVSGTPLGRVRDGVYDTEGGGLNAIGLTEGLAADVAVGVRDIPARLVVGFDGEAVVLADDVLDAETSGGAAAVAGRGVAVATKATGDAVERVAGAAGKAAAYGASAARVAAKSKAGRAATGWLKAIKDEVVDAMGDADED
jgi:uncharacterized protein YrrD